VIVSIARELGAGGRTVGEAVAAALGAVLLDEKSIIAELSERAGVSPEYVAERIERPPSAGDQLIADLAAASAMVPFAAVYQQADEIMIDAVRELVMEKARAGHVVAIGHGGVSMLGWRPSGIPVCALLLRAGRPWRIEQLARRYGIDAAEAQRRIERTDEARARYQRHYFNSDVYDSRQYDLVLCTETLGLATSARLAAEAVTARASA
jgi:cytidylate kinase